MATPKIDQIRKDVSDEVRDAGNVAADLIHHGLPQSHEAKKKRLVRSAEALGLIALTGLTAWAGPRGLLKDGPIEPKDQDGPSVVQVHSSELPSFDGNTIKLTKK